MFMPKFDLKEAKEICSDYQVFAATDPIIEHYERKAKEMFPAAVARIEELESKPNPFKNGDYNRIGFILSGEYRQRGCDCLDCKKATAMLRRLRRVAGEMEILG
jgi:hypothetical protein